METLGLYVLGVFCFILVILSLGLSAFLLMERFRQRDRQEGDLEKDIRETVEQRVRMGQ